MDGECKGIVWLVGVLLVKIQKRFFANNLGCFPSSSQDQEISQIWNYFFSFPESEGKERERGFCLP